MGKRTDIAVRAIDLYFLPVRTRVPLKFGTEVLTEVTCARVRVEVEDRQGNRGEGWGETPLSVQWAWPSHLPYARRCELFKEFCGKAAKAWLEFHNQGHPLELGYDFQEQCLPTLLREFNEDSEQRVASRLGAEPMPRLAALICVSAFDLAVHDAYGQVLGLPVYDSYSEQFLSRDLADFLTPAEGFGEPFKGKYPTDFLVRNPPTELPAWHLVGGLDSLEASEFTGPDPNDGYPVVLTDWIQRDKLQCLKIKLRGTDAAWDFQRLVRVGQIGQEGEVQWLSADFNCTVQEPGYVNEILERLGKEYPAINRMLLYIEQPFPYDLEQHRIPVQSISARKPLFLDESAHDWRLVKLGRELGWTGVALKTCKTQSGAILSGCWAKAHGMQLMVQDLTNPMLAQIPHVLLASQIGTIMGVETNAMQFYPEASQAEARVHPGLYQRRDGVVNLSSVHGPGFGYRLEEIQRELPQPAFSGAWR